MKIAALIPAAGQGLRLGRGAKAFIKLSGKTLLERAVDNFQSHVDEIIVAVSEDMQEEARDLLTSQTSIVSGGTTRQQSVLNMLKASRADFVLIHDAARPFLSAQTIANVIEALQQQKAISVVMPVADTLIEEKTGNIIDRQALRAVQTPQAFERSLILEAHQRGIEKGLEATDDAGLVRALGHDVGLVKGTSWLMKITTESDFRIAEALASDWDNQTHG